MNDKQELTFNHPDQDVYGERTWKDDFGEWCKVVKSFFRR